MKDMTLVEAPVNNPGNLDLELEPGTILRCVTCHDTEIRGEVVALDLNKKALILVSPPEPGSKHTNNTIHMINTNNLKHVYEEREPAGRREQQLRSLDNTKLTKRVRDKVEEKRSKISTIGVGVTSEAQSLFNSIKKTIEDVRWSGKDIVVLGDVTITEPYTEKDMQIVSGRNPTSLDHISKIVRKHYEDQRKPSTT